MTFDPKFKWSKGVPASTQPSVVPHSSSSRPTSSNVPFSATTTYTTAKPSVSSATMKNSKYKYHRTPNVKPTTLSSASVPHHSGYSVHKPSKNKQSISACIFKGKRWVMFLQIGSNHSAEYGMCVCDLQCLILSCILFYLDIHVTNLSRVPPAIIRTRFIGGTNSRLRRMERKSCQKSTVQGKTIIMMRKRYSLVSYPHHLGYGRFCTCRMHHEDLFCYDKPRLWCLHWGSTQRCLDIPGLTDN